MKGALFHGTPAKITDPLEPRPSHLLDGKKVVFGTWSRIIALIAATRVGDNDLHYGFDGEGFAPYVEEAHPEAFKILDRGGYTIDAEGFEDDPRLGLKGVEFINQGAVPTVEEEYIPNIRSALEAYSELKFVPFGLPGKP